MEVLAHSHRARFLGLLCQGLWEGGSGIGLGSELVPESQAEGLMTVPFGLIWPS